MKCGIFDGVTRIGVGTGVDGHHLEAARRELGAQTCRRFIDRGALIRRAHDDHA